MSNRGALWDAGHDETVEVNQRALIDKVLARYSGEFTVFRELLQNADDAAATAVELHFDTKAFLTKQSDGQGPLPDFKNLIVSQWSFKNNGTVFREEDWNRLKKIAEGNPDEQKIGAFGVGFYSLFSVTEEPFVKSGSQWMGFYWKDKKDQLFARRGTLPEAESSQWTTFEMGLREPGPLPGRPMDIARFLASSITFMTRIRDVSLFLNGRRLVRIIKDTSSPTNIAIPRTMKASTSPRKTMNIGSVTSTPVNIRAEVVRWVYAAGSERTKLAKILPQVQPANNFLSNWISSFGAQTPSRTPSPLPPPRPKSPVDMSKVVESSVLLSVFTANVNVKLDKKMEQELERATKKKPPKSCLFQLIYTGKDEYDASEKEDADDVKDVGSVFQGLRADLEGNNSSRVYIGHATGQTTGFSGHISGRFIPTVERESIDLVDRNVSVWNTELLHIGGFLSRVAYENELASIKRFYDAAAESSVNGPDEALKTWLQNKCLHALQFFTFRPSTPSPDVSRIMSAAFFSSSDIFHLFSTAGVKNAADIRVANGEMIGFLKTLPTLPQELQTGASEVITLLQAKSLIKPIGVEDIIAELRSRCLEESEMQQCLKWRISLPRNPTFDQHFRTQFLAAGVFRIEGTGETPERIVPLSTLKTYVQTGGLVPLDGPFPPDTLPFAISKHISSPTALTDLFGWNAFSMHDWIVFLSSPSLPVAQSITASPPFAERVLLALAKAWANVSKANQDDIIRRLSTLTCIPTQLGLKIPTDAYFANVHVFQDLPMVQVANVGGGRNRAALDNLLSALGVRKHVDLQVVFNRMIKTGDWTVSQLVKYLASVKDTLTTIEFERLKHTPAFSKEEVPSEAKDTGPNAVLKNPKQVIGSLYEPTDALRELGLPILDWGNDTKWKPNSEEARFLFQLGLQRFPALPDLLRLAAGEMPIREIALKYFFDKFAIHYRDFQPSLLPDLAFIPAVRPDGSDFLAKHSEVFSEVGCMVLGFAVIKPSIREDAIAKLKIMRNPPATAVTAVLLSKPPRTEKDARSVFEYLTSMLGDFTSQQFQQLQLSRIIPAKTPHSASVTMVRPGECYFIQDKEQSHFHSKLFTFVDFGNRANNFLAACGVRNAPTTDEVAKMLIENPKGFYELAGGPERFKAELRQISASFSEISNDTKQVMKTSPILLGSRRVPEETDQERGRRRASSDPEREDDEIISVHNELLRPDQIVIIDDVNAYAQFRDSLYGAPQEDILETLYMALGSPRLSKLIKEEYRQTGEQREPSSRTNEIRKLVLQRLPLFLHERTQVRTLIKPEWMQNTSNFLVKRVARLTLQKTLSFGGSKVTKESEASAAAKREGYNRALILYIADNIPLDLYEVANSLCKMMFDHPKLDDSLLFSTILSTDLPSLRRRGYNVDRILNQQKAEREAREDARRRAEQEAEKIRLPGAFVDDEAPLLPKDNEKGPLVPPKQPFGQNPPDVSTGPDSTQDRENGGKGLFDSMKNRFTSRNSGQEANPSSSSHRSGLDRILPGHRQNAGIENGGPKWNTPTGGAGDAQPTPESDINKNVQQAINACRPEGRNFLQNRQLMETIKESLNEGYCDVSGMHGDLVHIGAVDRTKVYVAKDIPNPSESVLRDKLESIKRFISILQPLKKVYKVPDASVHIFYDLTGPVIAFNAGGALFMNLRYYEGWHDSQVKGNNRTNAIISWFFTFAHEIAHNLIGPHNAEHSYYMNQISQTHVISLIDTLQMVQFGAEVDID